MTDKMKIIEVKQSVFADNDADAEKLRKELKYSHDSRIIVSPLPTR